MIGITNVVNKNQAESESVNISLITNQISHGDVLGATFTLTYGDFSKTYTWDGSVLTVSVPAHVNYTIAFGDIEGYRKPSDVTYTAQAGNSRTLNVKYETEVVSVTLNADNGASVNGAKVNINGKQQTWNGNALTQKVPFGTSYTVSVGEMSGFSTPASKSFKAEQAVREVSFTYIASALKVNILSNQSTDSSWDPTITNVKATVAYGSTTLQVSNGQQVNLTSGVNVTISFPEVEGYLKPSDITFTHNGGLVEKSGTYQCELLTVNVSADQGSVSGFEVTISKQETVGVATKYTRLEYIESTGTQYIDTGFVPNQDTRVLASMAVPVSSDSNYAFGSRTSSSSNNYSFAASQNGYYVSGYGTKNTSINSSYNTSEQFTIDKDKNVTKINGTVVATETYTSFTCPQNMTICAFNTKGTINYGKVKVYSFKIYNNGTLIRDYIPVLRSDGIVGLYDAVNDTFTSSSGSGNFIAGGKHEEVIATQTSVTGTYKIPFNASYAVQASKVSGYETPQSVTRVANAKSYVVEQKYEVIKVKDLSLFDVYGNSIQRSTANCYVIREAGQYKFPCVYGNAIKNGKVNTAAFTNNGGANSHDFVNWDNEVITSPYIENDVGFELDYVYLGNHDSDGVISNISITEEDGLKFVNFNVLSIPSSGANAVIEVSAGGELIFWSWHIWLWPHDLSPVEITNSTGVKYNIMPVNLASKYDSDGVHIKNWFYQWGRKDPMLLPSAWNSTTDHTPGRIYKASKATDLDNGIRSCATFYYNSSSPYNWFGNDSYYNLWDAACTGTGNSDNDTVKTVYDPCPVGWKVPNGNTFTGLSIISNANGIVKMRRYSGDTVGVDFPLSGYRNISDGSLYVGSVGYVWLSSAHSQNYAFNLSFISYNLTPQSNYGRAYGFSVRPVQDDNIQLDVIMISFKIRDTTYQAESGMTWSEWCQSSYNTGGYYIDGGNQIRNSGHYVVDEAGPEYFAKGNFLVRGGYTYITENIYG